MQNYKNIIPKRYHNVSYETDISENIKEILKKQIRAGNGIYFYGEPGVGKTYTVCAIAKGILKNGIDVMFLNTGDFLEKIRNEFDRKGSYDEGDDYIPGIFEEVMNFKGIIIFDDIGAEKTSDWVRERLYLIINKKYEDMIPMIFTSNCDLEILSARLGDRITSRIRGMTCIIRKNGEDRRLSSNTQ